MQKVMSVAPSTLDDLTDDTDGNDNDTEMEELLKTIKGKNDGFRSNKMRNYGYINSIILSYCIMFAELTQEVSRLQAELNKIKLQEFEAQEQTVDLTSELEEERRMRSRIDQELKVIIIKTVFNKYSFTGSAFRSRY